MSIDWNLLGPPVDVGAHFQAGLERGRAVRKRAETESALAAYAQNPNDPNAQSALFAVAPELSYKLTQQRTAEAELALKSRQAGIAAQAGQLYASGDSRGAISTALAGGDAETAKQFMALDKSAQDLVAAKYKAAGPVLYRAQQMPYEQRKALIASAAPTLLGQGWTPQEIEGFDPTDEALQGLVTSVMTVEQLTDRQKVDYKVVPEGGRLEPFNYLGQPISNGQPAPTITREGTAGNGASYKDPYYDNLEAPLEQKYGLPAGLMSRIRTRGERSNADQVSSAGGKTVYQVIPSTRDLFLKKYGIDAYAGPEQAAEVAALHLRDDIAAGRDPVRGYIGGPDKSQWGPQTQSYAERVNGAGANDSPDKVRAQAAAAIAQGADPVKVRQRAAELGVSI